MCRAKPYCFLIVLCCCLAFKAHCQATRADSIKAELQGAWRMDDDTNVVLLFTGDSMLHRMVRTSGMARVSFRVTNKSCDTTWYKPDKSFYIEEIYRYYQNKMPRDGKLCNKIVYLKNGMLILKRDGLFESFTKQRTPLPRK